MVEDNEHQLSPQGPAEPAETGPAAGVGADQESAVEAQPERRVIPGLYGYDRSQWP